MDELEPWNMFTSDSAPDDAIDGGGDGDEGGGGGSGDDGGGRGDEESNDNNEQFTIPSPVQDMQVKEEPQEPPVEDNAAVYDDGDNGYGFHSILGDRDPNEEDHSLFDFNSENSNSCRSGGAGRPVIAEQAPLSAEDEYYFSLVKYEDAMVYICPACGLEYRSQEDWKAHLNSMHQYNTRRGLNFLQLDKLYHECMECHKRIAMHSMENLLKHKFTHLPYRCYRCFICKREYKYRQDVMIHLKMNHRDELIKLAKEEEKLKKRLEPQHSTIRSILSKPPATSINTSRPKMTIGQVKENAVDIFDSNTDNIEVRNEVINDDDDEDNSLSGLPPAKRLARDLPIFLDDVSTNGSSNEQRSTAPARLLDDIDESLEEYILFTCPQCSSESETPSQWREHIESSHDFASRKGLNMRDINQGQAQCLECNQTIIVNTICNLQMHKFEHLPHKKWMNCKLCFTSFSLTKDVIKHLAEKHHLMADLRTANNADNDEESREPFSFVGDDYDEEGAGAADTKKLLAGFEGFMSKQEERDAFEKHMDYLCPECGTDFNDKKLWRKHMADTHQLGDLETLNFEVINERQLKCRECDKIITNAYGIQNAQQHRFTHMKFKSFAICRICRKQYTDRKGLMKHLRSTHGVGEIGITSLRNVPSPNPNFGCAIMPIKSLKAMSYKEIVRHQNYTYEICYLEEDDDNYNKFGRGDTGSSSNTEAAYDFAKGDAHLFQRSHIEPKNNLDKMSRYRCVDCGSNFASQQSLQHHIKTEHEFVDYSHSTSTRNSPKKDYSSKAEEKSNDTEDLLVPSKREVDVVKNDDPNTVECHFIYICPQCGVEFKLRHLWRRHINMEHNFDKRESLDFRTVDKFRYQCRTCHELLQSSKLKGLQDHKFRHCPYRQYLKCLICGQAYNHKPNMISHLRQRHNIVEAEPSQHLAIAMENRKQSNVSKQFGGNSGSRSGGGGAGGVCQSGNISKTAGDKNYTEFSSSSANTNVSRPPGLQTVEDVISFHNAVDHESITYHCPSCMKTFDSHVFWRKHIVDEHNLNSREGLNFRQLDDHHYICLQCYKRVTVTHTKGAIGQLQSHKFRHLPYKSFHCTACKGQFVRKQMFFKHLDKITNKCSGVMANDDITINDGTETNETTQLADELATEDNTIIENDSSASKYIWPTRASLPAQATTYENPSENQGCFTLSCPQCGVEYETTRAWREHINIEHNLNSRNVLNFRKINSKLHLCLECNEHVNGRKLRDLQVHKFKHLPFGAYLHCRFCTMNYFHISNMQEHLKNKHPQMLQKVKQENYEDDDTGNMDMEDEDDDAAGHRKEADDDDGYDAEVEAVDSPSDLEDIVDIDLLEAEAEIEEVDPDNVESDDQYLLG